MIAVGLIGAMTASAADRVTVEVPAQPVDVTVAGASERLRHAEASERNAAAAFERAILIQKRAEAANNQAAFDVAKRAADVARDALARAQAGTANAQAELAAAQAAEAGKMPALRPEARGPNTVKFKPVPAPVMKRLAEATRRWFDAPGGASPVSLILDALQAGNGDMDRSVDELAREVSRRPGETPGQEALSFVQGMRESKATFDTKGSFLDRPTGASLSVFDTPPPADAKPWLMNKWSDERNAALRDAMRGGDGSSAAIARTLDQKAAAGDQAARNALRYVRGYQVYQEEAGR